MAMARFPENLIAAATGGAKPIWRVKAWRKPNEDDAGRGDIVICAGVPVKTRYEVLYRREDDALPIPMVFR